MQKGGAPTLKSPTTKEMVQEGTGRDVEKQSRPNETETQPSKEDNQWIVKWDGENDPDDPLNTLKWKKS